MGKSIQIPCQLVFLALKSGNFHHIVGWVLHRHWQSKVHNTKMTCDSWIYLLGRRKEKSLVFDHWFDNVLDPSMDLWAMVVYINWGNTRTLEYYSRSLPHDIFRQSVLCWHEKQWHGHIECSMTVACTLGTRSFLRRHSECRIFNFIFQFETL